ncbi:TPA: RICH domain-containing protein, partial [Streptococcus pneumoniae]
MSKILDDIKKHHLKKEKHHQIVALIKDLDKLKKQALSEIDNVNTKVEIENTVHKVFADMDTVVTKFQKGLIQNTPQVPEAPKAPDTPQIPEAPAPETPAPAPEAPKTGWKQENGMWYFYNTDGSMATGWLEYNGSWYYLNANGAMA